jgi:hypothetical protein
MSNTIKIMARRKNRIEKGIRAVLFGSNPHSNGEDFSRSMLDRIDTIFITIIKAHGIITEIINIGADKFIY